MSRIKLLLVGMLVLLLAACAAPACAGCACRGNCCRCQRATPSPEEEAAAAGQRGAASRRSRPVCRRTSQPNRTSPTNCRSDPEAAWEPMES
ncbi:MAG: hypothetical protein R2856_08180 [Caldilineaceae bacterium]